MRQITDPKELIDGEAYWLRSKTFPESPLQIGVVNSGPPDVTLNGIWASGRNPQAFDKWEIVGPVPKPEEWRS